MTLENPPESTPEQPFEAVAARHGTRSEAEPASTEGDGRTPEERLLARRRLGSAYLEDVRRLIDERDMLEAEVARLRELLRTSNAQNAAAIASFGSIETRVHEE